LAIEANLEAIEDAIRWTMEEHEELFPFKEKARHELEMGHQKFTLLLYEVE